MAATFKVRDGDNTQYTLSFCSPEKNYALAPQVEILWQDHSHETSSKFLGVASPFQALRSWDGAKRSKQEKLGGIDALHSLNAWNKLAMIMRTGAITKWSYTLHGCHSQRFLKFLDFSLTIEWTISEVSPENGLNAPLKAIPPTHLLMLLASQVQRKWIDSSLV